MEREGWGCSPVVVCLASMHKTLGSLLEWDGMEWNKMELE
jgi:hypothetical protein